ncbi:threonylcarbamoyl-AMP synthase [Candidatus Uhrbacteria bacterium]|nr:threonylcarbamoyl-AMP synthase [Candidatus Uhrbacteria bacterium]
MIKNSVISNTMRDPHSPKRCDTSCGAGNDIIFHSLKSLKLALLLKTGAIGVIPTDTIYGISASALDKKAIERIYAIRGRDRAKPFIVLISSLDDIALFGTSLTNRTREDLMRIWPAPVSIILPCTSKKFHYLHRGIKSMAFRVPAWAPLRTLLKKTGPLVSTSANPEGEKPAETIGQAKKYFGTSLDFYVEKGMIRGLSSTVLRLTKDGFEVLRHGAAKKERLYIEKQGSYVNTGQKSKRWYF